MAPIDWYGFTWEAFATLASGLAAVIAAFIIGQRQTGIADRQTRILERQAWFDELGLRTELFDRRFEVYEATRKFIASIVAHAKDPDTQLQHDFLGAMDRAKFLFAPAVRERLEEVWQKSCALGAVTSEMTALYHRTGEYGRENIDEKYELLQFFSEKLGRLSDIFGDELRLSGHGP